MLQIVSGEALFEPPVVVVDAAHSAFAFIVRKCLLEGIEGVQDETAGVALLHPDRAGMISVVPVVRNQVDRSELGERLIVLGRLENRIQHVDVFGNVEPYAIGVPGIDQADAGLTLISPSSTQFLTKFHCRPPDQLMM